MPPQAYDPEEIALLEGIHDAPRDDAPRLIYSDWLEDHGHDDLAAFIRWQVGGERAGLSEDDLHHTRFHRPGLIDLAAARWMKPPPPGKARVKVYVGFSRGLPIIRFKRCPEVDNWTVDEALARLPPAVRLAEFSSTASSLVCDPVFAIGHALMRRVDRLIVEDCNTPRLFIRTLKAVRKSGLLGRLEAVALLGPPTGALDFARRAFKDAVRVLPEGKPSC